MKTFLIRAFATGLLAVGLGGAAQAAVTPDKLDGTKLVSAEQVRDLIGKGVPVVDTRVAAEYAEKTIKGAISVPYKEKSSKDASFDAKLDNFDLGKLPTDKNAPLVLFCNAGECWKSYKAAVVARNAGYKQVYWFRGGMTEWTGKGLPTQ